LCGIRYEIDVDNVPKAPHIRFSWSRNCRFISTPSAPQPFTQLISTVSISINASSKAFYPTLMISIHARAPRPHPSLQSRPRSSIQPLMRIYFNACIQLLCSVSHLVVSQSTTLYTAPIDIIFFRRWFL
jgi:hypothetical protein